jgi:hypothetical protein
MQVSEKKVLLFCSRQQPSIRLAYRCRKSFIMQLSDDHLNNSPLLRSCSHPPPPCAPVPSSLNSLQHRRRGLYRPSLPRHSIAPAMIVVWTCCCRHTGRERKDLELGDVESENEGDMEWTNYEVPFLPRKSQEVTGTSTCYWQKSRCRRMSTPQGRD